jgi:hypothetical protein
MFTRFVAATAATAASSIALAQGTASFDVLEPAETSGTIPANTRIVDMYFDVAATDAWTAAGIRALTENGATFIYFDSDPNTAGLQPGLINGGTANRFTTMLSRPRVRDGAGRFTNAGARVTGAWDPASGVPVTQPGELNVVHITDPSATPGTPSVDGYIARIAVDISAVPPIPGVDIHDYSNWGVGPIGSIPAGARVVLRSIGLGQPGGTVTNTFDVPQFNFANWAMWYVPEPTSLALLALGGLTAIRRR